MQEMYILYTMYVVNHSIFYLGVWGIVMPHSFKLSCACLVCIKR